MRPRQVLRGIALLMAVALLAAPASLLAQSKKKPRSLTFRRYSGVVHLSVPGQPQLLPLNEQTNLSVKGLSTIAVITNAGWAEYGLDRRMEVHQNADTTLTFESAEETKSGFLLRMTLEHGACLFTTDPGRNNAIQIQANGIEVRASGKAYFLLESDGYSTRVTVTRGKVQVTAPDGVREVAAGYYLSYRVGTFSRVALSKPRVRKPAGSGSGGGFFSFASANFDFYDYYPCGYSNGYYCYATYGGAYEHRHGTNYGGHGNGHPRHTPHHPPVAPPSTPPTVGTPTATLPGNGEPPRKFFMDAATVTAQREVARPFARFTPTSGEEPAPRWFAGNAAGSSVERSGGRNDSWAARQNAPLADRVEVAHISHSRSDARGEGNARGGYSGNSGNNSSGGSSSSSSAQQGSSSSSGASASNSSGSSSSSSSPAASAPAAAPAPPSSTEREPGTARPGKPD